MLILFEMYFGIFEGMYVSKVHGRKKNKVRSETRFLRSKKQSYGGNISNTFWFWNWVLYINGCISRSAMNCAVVKVT
jgi:hypothetical protein